MAGEYAIKLNFLALRDVPPPFRVYRRLRQANDARPESGTFGFSLPVSPDKDRAKYWVRLSEATGFEEYWARATDNVHLTQRALFEGLVCSATATLDSSKFELPRDGFYEEMRFNFAEHSEGCEQLTIQPYLLRLTREYGWLIDYHFHVHEGVPFSRRIQQLSLSLDRNFKRNLDSYSDRARRIQTYRDSIRHVLDAVMLPGSNTASQAADAFRRLPAKRLQSKVYLFNGDGESRSQFTGLRQYGPLEPIREHPRLLFAFREIDRQAARTLAMALQGSRHRQFNFPGFESLFKTPITVDPNPIVLPDLTRPSFDAAVEMVQQVQSTHRTTVPIFVLPDGDDNGYMEHKSAFAHAGIPTQVCTLRVVNDDYSLKWAIANIALQIFCKAGGKPWKVRPTADRTLIIGISQSHKTHKENEATVIDKYFAFSVMSDNSGLFQRLRVLSEAQNQTTYLDALRANLREVLAEGATEFSQIVVHTSFRLKRKEMSAIEATVRDVANDADSKQCRFAVVKVNHRNRFFGINPQANSLVPYEGTLASLGGGEYLVWFEGIFPDKQTVTKAYPGPTHIALLRTSSDDAIADEAILQDLVNLSGANWRGFNAKSAPVSVFYCHLVAEMVHEFHQAGLPLPQVQDLKPWFL